MMHRDLRATDVYRETEALYRSLRGPGTGRISDAAEIDAAPDGRRAAFAGTLMDKLEGAPSTRICLTDLLSGDTRVLSFGPNIDRLPKFSPDARTIAFLSDRHRAGDFQLYLLDVASGEARAAPRAEGWVEYLHWSPDGRRILLGVAGHGADLAGGQGAVTSRKLAGEIPPWMPTVETGEESCRWRRAWVYEVAEDRVRQVSTDRCNVWECVWCGNDALAVVVSPQPGEGFWYGASLHLIAAQTGESREVYAPRDQLGWPAASPSGKHLAIVEAVCSDRGLVAGDLRLIDTVSGSVREVATAGVDVTCAEWSSERTLMLAGHRGLESVVGAYDVALDQFTEAWRSQDISGVGRYISVSTIGNSTDCILVGEGFKRAPEIAAIRDGDYRVVKSFDLDNTDSVRNIAAIDPITWNAPDGLEIQGWLLRPRGEGPYPLVMFVHGGPVYMWRPTWLGRRYGHALMLLKRGYAVFFPNPRGSSGRGQAFARHVVGDMGGADTFDYLSGLDHLIGRNIADARRLGVTGGSYGGFMTSWLITQDSRFAAAVSSSPVTNQVTEHLVSNIPHFVSLFLNDKYTNLTGRYFQRSPIMHAHKTKTPTLNLCGALDRCTPPEEAMQFHNALLENGVTSALVMYPEEGHGVRKFPAVIDYAARTVSWFDKYME